MANVKRLVRTAYSVRMQAIVALGNQWQPEDHSTVNEALTIQQDAMLNAGQVPAIKYLFAGNGGLTYTLGSDGITVPRYLQHSPTDAMPFNVQPWVLRTIDNDLSAIERARYCMRRVEEHDGIQHFAYYGLRIDTSGVSFTYTRTVTVNGVSTPYTFTPSTDNLTPTPVDVSTDGAVVTSSESLNVTGPMTVSLSQDHIDEYIAAMEIIYGDTNHGFISELMLAAGVDRSITAYTGEANTPISFNEAIGVTAITHIVMNIPVDTLNDGYTLTIKMGNGEPLLTTEDYTSAVVYTNG